jgi:hypothetical protein
MELKMLSNAVIRDLDALIDHLQRAKRAVELGGPQTYQFPTTGAMDLAVRWGEICEMQRLSYAFRGGV